MESENRKQGLNSGIYSELKLGVDFGNITGFEKPVLFKSGAEKIKQILGLRVEAMDCVNEVFYYGKQYIDVTYKCIITGRDGSRAGICEGSANSEEDSFRYIYTRSGISPCKSEAEKMRAEGSGKWIKEGERYVWLTRKPNPARLALKNTIKKIAQKRAFVGAVIMASAASEIFSTKE